MDVGWTLNPGLVSSLETDEKTEKVQRGGMREDGGRIGMTQKPMHARDCGQLVEARREAWDGFIFGGLRRNLPCPHLDIGLLPSRILCDRVCPRCLHLPGLRGFVTAAPGRQGRQAGS